MLFFQVLNIEGPQGCVLTPVLFLFVFFFTLNKSHFILKSFRDLPKKSCVFVFTFEVIVFFLICYVCFGRYSTVLLLLVFLLWHTCSDGSLKAITQWTCHKQTSWKCGYSWTNHFASELFRPAQVRFCVITAEVFVTTFVSTLSDRAKTAGGCQQSRWGSRPRSPAVKKKRESFASSHKKSFTCQWAIMRTFCVSLLCLVWGRRFPGLHFTLNCTW